MRSNWAFSCPAHPTSQRDSVFLIWSVIIALVQCFEKRFDSFQLHDFSCCGLLYVLFLQALKSESKDKGGLMTAYPFKLRQRLSILLPTARLI